MCGFIPFIFNLKSFYQSKNSISTAFMVSRPNSNAIPFVKDRKKNFFFIASAKIRKLFKPLRICSYSLVVEQMTVNHQVGGSNPSKSAFKVKKIVIGLAYFSFREAVKL